MKYYAKYDEVSGEILETGYCSLETFQAMVDKGDPILEGLVRPETHYVANGQLVEYTEPERARKANQPTPFHTWSNTTKVWVDTRSLSNLRRAKELQINDMRAQKNQTSFTYQGKEIQCDLLSMQDIMGINGEVALTGNLPSNFPGAWKTLDNSYVMIPNVATWTQFYQAMVTRGASNFARSQALKNYVNTLDDPDAIAAVNWDTVIPS